MNKSLVFSLGSIVAFALTLYYCVPIIFSTSKAEYCANLRYKVYGFVLPVLGNGEKKCKKIKNFNDQIVCMELLLTEGDKLISDADATMKASGCK